MRAIGERCGWVIPRKERRVLKLLRIHTREREREFVAKNPILPGGQRRSRIVVQFAEEASSAFEPKVEILEESEGLARS